MVAAVRPVEARYSVLHNISMAAVSAGMVTAAIVYFVRNPANAPTLSPNDPRFVLFTMLAAAMAYYVYIGVSRYRNRTPQLVIDRDGVFLGFGRDRRLAWKDIQWVRLRRLALRPQLEIGVAPEAFIAANLRLSMWNLDDGLRPIRGMPTAVLVRDNGLDITASAMLDAARTFRPNLVKS
ncbi:hypothetical protein [Reyranella sp.]|uniref:hypothetical protein n=1 Tax=Reyranella sp. TaxID=1929291 RepID=UPI0037848388